MKAVVLHRVGILAHFCPKQGRDFKPSGAPLYPKMGQVSPPPPPLGWLSHYITRIVGLDGDLVGAVFLLARFDAPQSNTL